MIIRTIYIPNGDIEVPYNFYKCKSCKKEVGESDNHYIDENDVYCIECSFRLGFIDGATHMNGIGFGLLGYEVDINPNGGEIEIKHKKGYFSWEMSPSQLRKTPEYRKWRNTVLERDNYTCQDCNKTYKSRGLHTHHIKPFAQYPKLRKERHRVEGY